MAYLKRLTKIEELRIVEGYKLGASVKVLSRRHAWGIQTIYRVLRQHGITLRNERGEAIYLPTLEQIEASAAVIRAGWDEQTRLDRTVIKPIPLEIPYITFIPSRGVGTI